MHLTVEAKTENIETVTEFVNAQLKKMGCSHRAATQIDIALDELFSNICRYAYGEETGMATIRIEEIPGQNEVCISLEDSGTPFNPLAHGDPDVTLGIHERDIGGLGIFMVKNIMKDIQYEYREGRNILTVSKSL